MMLEKSVSSVKQASQNNKSSFCFFVKNKTDFFKTKVHVHVCTKNIQLILN